MANYLLMCGMDIGRDPDTATALVYQAGDPDLELVGATTSHMIPERRARITEAVLSYLEQDVSVGVGAKYVGEETEEDYKRYMKKHSALGFHYEGNGIDWQRYNVPERDAKDLIIETAEKYEDELYIAALGPMTDLAEAVSEEEELMRNIGGINIMGQVKMEQGVLVPDGEAYNCALDMDAAEKIIGMRDEVQVTVLSKYAAGEMILNKEHFEEFSETGNPVGEYLKQHAEDSLRCFARRDPDIFRRVFGIEESEQIQEMVESINEVSKPYDGATVASISNPEWFKARELDGLRVIGVDEENSGVRDSEMSRERFVESILEAL